MKKASSPCHLILCLSLLIALCLSSCAEKPEYAQRPTLVVQGEVTTTSEQLVLALENFTDRSIGYPEPQPHQLQKREGNEWIDIPLSIEGKNIVAQEFGLKGTIPGGTHVFYIPIATYYGAPLSVGEYRLTITYRLFNADISQTIDDAWYFLVQK